MNSLGCVGCTNERFKGFACKGCRLFNIKNVKTEWEMKQMKKMINGNNWEREQIRKIMCKSD